MIPEENATEGRIIHVRKPEVSHCVPAIVVRTWGSAVNVLLFPDGGNDGYHPVAQDPSLVGAYALPWMTSVPHDEGQPGYKVTWHWPERT